MSDADQAGQGERRLSEGKREDAERIRADGSSSRISTGLQ